MFIFASNYFKNNPGILLKSDTIQPFLERIQVDNVMTILERWSSCLNYFVNPHPDKISWPEVFFYIINILYLVIASYYILVAYAEAAWQTSMDLLQTNFKMMGDNVGLYFVSVFHHIIALILLVLLIVGIYAAYKGLEKILQGYCVLMLLTILLELYFAFSISVRADNCMMNIRKLTTVLRGHVKNVYRHEQYQGFLDKSLDPVTGEFISQPLWRRYYCSEFLMASIQRSFGCCGFDSYFDYLDPTKAPSLHDPINRNGTFKFKIPQSCCTPKYALNIHCSSELSNTSGEPMSKYIYVQGCTSRITQLCNDMIHSSSRGAFFICFVHFFLFVLSIPLVIIQIKTFHFIASDIPIHFRETKFNNLMLDHTHPRKLDDYEDKAHSFTHDFHRDSDFVLSDEMRQFVHDMKRQHGIETDVDLHRNVLITTRVGPKGKGSLEEMPAFAMTREDKRKFKQHEGRFNYFLNKQLLNYAAAVLNSDPYNADANSLQDMKQAEMLAKMNIFYKDVIKDQKAKLAK
ncbi:unnamed protein product [Allacma fusca]|uniref:Uncharacterized protein n=1 Tax=Allacma fusca TaxID=39272 RepID=A0A8J2KUC1_9HEXA|nr:unnamed protein product [Allacma fusca]